MASKPNSIYLRDLPGPVPAQPLPVEPALAVKKGDGIAHTGQSFHWNRLLPLSPGILEFGWQL